MSNPDAPPALTGHIDQADRFSLTGWAMDPARPDEPVALELVLDGTVVGSFAADRHRPDLEQAGLGDGRHAFQVQIPGGLSQHAERVLELRRAGDGAPVPGSPVVLARAPLAGETARRVLADAVEAAMQGADRPALEALLAELVRGLSAMPPGESAKPPVFGSKHDITDPAVLADFGTTVAAEWFPNWYLSARNAAEVARRLVPLASALALNAPDSLS